MKKLNIDGAIKRYNSIMETIGYEHNLLEQDIVSLQKIGTYVIW